MDLHGRPRSPRDQLSLPASEVRHRLQERVRLNGLKDVRCEACAKRSRALASTKRSERRGDELPP